LPVLRNVCHGKMRMVIQDWLLFGVFLVEPPGSFGMEKKVFSNEAQVLRSNH